MNLPRLFTIVFPLVFLLPNLSGCIAFYSTKDFQITVRDRITMEPIEGAHLTVRYSSKGYINQPADAECTTDANGEAVISSTNYRPGFVSWDITAPGYQLAGGAYSGRTHMPGNFKTDREGHALIEMLSDKDHQKWLQKMRARWPEVYKQNPPKKE